MSMPKWNTSSSKFEDDINQNGRQPQTQWQTTSSKMEDKLSPTRRQPKNQAIKNGDDQK